MKRTLCLLLVLCVLAALLPCSAFADKETVVGTSKDNHYVNNFFGIQADFPEPWVALDDEQIAEVMGYVVDNVSIEGFEELLEQNGTVTDLMTVAQDNSGDNVNIQIEKLPAQAMGMTSEAIASGIIEQLKTAMRDMGAENVDVELDSYDFAGKERTSLNLRMTFGGVYYYERLVMLREGSYLATVTAFSQSSAQLDKLLNYFEALT